MKGIHSKSIRLLFHIILYSSIVLSTNSHADFRAAYTWNEGQPDGFGVTPEAACQDLFDKEGIWVGDTSGNGFFESVVNSSDEVLHPCGDGWQTYRYPACLMRTNGEPSGFYMYCHYLAEIHEVASPETYTIDVVPEEGALTMIPPTSSTDNQKLKLIAVVRDSNNNVLPDIRVKLSVEVKANSGGHEHDSPVRHDTHPGKLSGINSGVNKVEGTTTADGYKFTFTPPIVSGVHKIIATCIDIDCGIGMLDNILVGIDNLTSLGVGNWSLVGGVEGRHTDNHYLTSTSISRITDIAQQYNARYLGANLYLNDASLIRGGLFDTENTWNPPHFEHRKGTVIDVRANNNTGAIPPRNWKTFSRYVRLFSGSSNLERFYNENTGEEVIRNRHFHVRLEGRRE